jgi:hypothetical protein
MRMAFAGIPFEPHFWGKVTVVKGFAHEARRSAKAGLRYAFKGVNRTVLNDPVSP